MDALRLEPGGGVRALSFAIKAVELKVARCHVFGDGVLIAFAIFFKGKHTLIRRSKMDFNLVCERCPDKKPAASIAEIGST